MSSQNLSNIIKACIQGDQVAQRSLYEAHRVRWYMTCLRYGKNKTQAEDILQEGLIGIYRDLHQYDSQKGAFTTWSNRVIVNAALKYLKKFSWSHAMGDIDTIDDRESDMHNAYEKLLAEELTSLIQKLPVGYRVVFNMYAIEGFKHEEIAKQLGIKVGTSKSQLFKARKMVKKLLEQQLIVNRHE